MSVISLCFRSHLLFKLSKQTLQNVRYVKTRAQKLKVTLCGMGGGGGSVGKYLSLLLKQSPLIDEVAVYDNEDTCYFIKELAHVDTRCKLSAYTGTDNIQKALQDSKVVVMLVSSRQTCHLPYPVMFRKNCKVFGDFVEQFARSCPRALLAIATNPLNSMVPLASEILKQNGVYNPKAVFGVTTLDVVRANTFAANVLGIEPECVFVPVIGGHADKSIVPVFSQTKPYSDFTDNELEKITLSVQTAYRDVVKAKSNQTPYLSSAFAVSRFVISLIKGLTRHSNVVECAYVRSDVHPDVKYLSTQVLLGPSGVQRNLGLPPLTEYERCLLENAVPVINEDVEMGEKFAKGIP